MAPSAKSKSTPKSSRYLSYSASKSTRSSVFFARRRSRMTSLASEEVSGIFTWKRAWILEKSFAEIDFIWPTMSSMFSWEVTMTQESPPQ